MSDVLQYIFSLIINYVLINSSNVILNACYKLAMFYVFLISFKCIFVYVEILFSSLSDWSYFDNEKTNTLHLLYCHDGIISRYSCQMHSQKIFLNLKTKIVSSHLHNAMTMWVWANSVKDIKRENVPVITELSQIIALGY